MARKKPVLNLDEQAFEILSAQVKAKEEENRISQGILTGLKLNSRLSTEILERYAHLGEDNLTFIQEIRAIGEDIKAELKTTRELLNQLSTSEQALTAVLREIVDELSKRLDRFETSISQRIGRLEDIELLQLSGQRISKRKVTKLVTELTREQKQRELQQHYLNLAELRVQAARYSMNVPVNITNDIRYAEECIQQLEAELND